MTSRESLENVKKTLEFINFNSKKGLGIYANQRDLDIIERDIILVESFKKVLSKVVNVVHQPEIISKENENGSIAYYLNHEYKIAEDFDVEAFKNIIDQLGYKLVKKEN